MKRLLALFLILLMLPLSALAEQTSYEAALADLNGYLCSDPGAYYLPLSTILTDMQLSSAGYSHDFTTYISILLAVEENRFADADAYLRLMAMNQNFVALLDDATFKANYPGIGTLTDLQCYVYGRQAEYQGNTALATTYYTACIRFYDSAPRMLAAISSASHVTATPYVTATPRRATPTPYTPSSTPTPFRNYSRTGYPVGYRVTYIPRGGSCVTRSGPGEEYSQVNWIMYGETFTILATATATTGRTWYMIENAGIECWVSSNISNYFN